MEKWHKMSPVDREKHVSEFDDNGFEDEAVFSDDEQTESTITGTYTTTTDDNYYPNSLYGISEDGGVLLKANSKSALKSTLDSVDEDYGISTYGWKASGPLLNLNEGWPMPQETSSRPSTAQTSIASSSKTSGTKSYASMAATSTRTAGGFNPNKYGAPGSSYAQSASASTKTLRSTVTEGTGQPAKSARSSKWAKIPAYVSQSHPMSAINLC